MKSSKTINSIDELKKLNEHELLEAAQSIRQFLISSLSKTGGHLGSNLGVVELTMAIHYLFDSPKDKLIFDVGHQCYVHKILTGRADQFESLRQYNGLSGFIKSKESIHDVWEAGHSSTSISAAVGFAQARDILNDDSHIICVIGDGSLTNGMAMEAINHLASLNTKVIIILNDNEMSISKNIGFIDNVLKDLQQKSKYYSFKDNVHNLLTSKYFFGGKKIDKMLRSTKNVIKDKISKPHSFFNTLGLKYIGPVDGHDFSDLFESLESAKKMNESVLIHVKTTKGKGYQFAEDNSWHSIAPFDVETGKVLQKNTSNSYSKIIADQLEQLMQEDEKIYVVTPAMLGGSELDSLKNMYPKRVTDVGIAEEHAITFSGALALGGLKPFVSIYSTFLQRAYDQMFHDLARQNANVVIGIDRAGLVGSDGETHQGIYDISFLSHIPNVLICQGKNDFETIALLDYCFSIDGLKCIRYPRGGGFSNQAKYQNYNAILDTNWTISNKQASKCIITYGPDVVKYEELASENDICVINARFIRPLDEKLLLEIKDKEITVVEEHTGFGGLGSLILDFYNSNNIRVDLKMKNLGISFVPQGDVSILKDKYKISVEEVLKQL